MERPEELIEDYQLERHPEGGYYRRVYESPITVGSEGLSDEYEGTRRAGSAVLYLLTEDDVSRLHRLKGDEMWHFYRGSPLRLHLFKANGSYQTIELGRRRDPCFLVKGGDWFGATVAEGFALVGCTVWPEFRFEDFEMADQNELLERFPEQSDLIRKLT